VVDRRGIHFPRRERIVSVYLGPTRRLPAAGLDNRLL
jgi:hypothetical protein